MMSLEEASSYAAALVYGSHDLEGYRDDYKGRFFTYHFTAWREPVTNREPRMVLRIYQFWGLFKSEHVYYPPRDEELVCVVKLLLDKVR